MAKNLDYIKAIQSVRTNEWIIYVVFKDNIYYQVSIKEPQDKQTVAEAFFKLANGLMEDPRIN